MATKTHPSEKLTCGICGKEVEKYEIIFIEVDYGLCKECAQILNNDIEEEMSKEREESCQ